GQSHAVYAIDLEGDTSKQLVAGTELQQPYLYAGEKAYSDSVLNGWLGLYNDPQILQCVLSYKMHYFWKNRNNLEIIFTGSSQPYGGIDCRLITGFSSINMSYPACGISGTTILVNNYVLNLCPKIRIVCMGLTLYWLADSGGNGWNLWTAGITSNKGYICDQEHQFWEDTISPEYEAAIIGAPYCDDGVTDTFGFLGVGCGGWGPDTPSCGGRIDWDTGDGTYKDNFALFKTCIERLATRGIHSIVVIFPENPGFKYTDHFMIGGPSWPTGRAVVSQLRFLENGNPYYHFYDAYNYGNHDYVSSDYCNSNHLCVDGAKKFTERLNALIDSILNK
ncbi:MAG: hypothetical protein JW768_16725, partial [Chitinispirillaceae bacterium]|nr:hypothetical protein [Chitinispirillaceae bacterium]